ncbi:MAG: hypothetical protein IJ155_02460 [Prevotella sp.]|nr:hypothetical protein [Prevotella sp.]
MFSIVIVFSLLLLIWLILKDVVIFFNWEASHEPLYIKRSADFHHIRLWPATANKYYGNACAKAQAHTYLSYFALIIPSEVAVRAGIEHHSQVLPANSFAKVRLLFELAKENAEKVSSTNFFGISIGVSLLL